MVFGMAEQYRNPVSAGSRHVTPNESSRAHSLRVFVIDIDRLQIRPIWRLFGRRTRPHKWPMSGFTSAG
jgi:hypothetical protein